MDAESGGRTRLVEQVRSMAPHQMAIAGLLGVAAVLAIVSLWQWSTAPSYQTLVVGEDPAIVSESISALEAAGIGYRVSGGGTTIEVERDRVADAEVRLAEAGVSTSAVPGYEILDQQGFSTSSFQQRINYQRALEGELTRTIIDLDQVLSASVHLSIPEDELFTDQEEAPTASVVIDTAGSIGSQAVDGIVNVVASAVPGMSPDGVTVTDSSGRMLSSNGNDISNDALLAKRSIEQQLETSAQSMLIAAFGRENAYVRVSAELELDDSEREVVTYNPESQIALREQTINEQYNGSAGPSEVSGVIGNTTEIIEGTATSAPAGATDYQRTEQTSEFGVDRITTVERDAAGDLVRLSVAVVVNDALEPKPDLNQITQVVSAAVGLVPERGDVIAVEAIPFDDQFAEELELPEVVAPVTDPLAPISPYLGIARNALAVVLLLIVLLSLRKGVKTLTASLKPIEPTVIDLDVLESSTVGGGAGDETTADAESGSDGQTLALGSGPASSEDVRRIIDQQPIEVASLLRSWADEAVSN